MSDIIRVDLNKCAVKIRYPIDMLQCVFIEHILDSAKIEDRSFLK